MGVMVQNKVAHFLWLIMYTSCHVVSRPIKELATSKRCNQFYMTQRYAALCQSIIIITINLTGKAHINTNGTIWQRHQVQPGRKMHLRLP